MARSGHDIPRESDWKAASQELRTQYQSGDLLVVAPQWLDPIGRLYFGDLIPVDMAARMDSARYGTIWELSVRGQRAAETIGIAPSWSKAFGSLQVRRFTRTPVEVVFDFVQQFVSGKASGPQAKPAASRLEEVGFKPRRCIRLVPRPDQRIEFTFAEAQLGTSLVVYVGLADVFTRRDVRDPGQLEVLINGTKVAGAVFGVDDGWTRLVAETTPGTAVVTFAATAVGPKSRDRQICFAAEARR